MTQLVIAVRFINALDRRKVPAAPEESRPGLLDAPEGRPRPGRVLKDAGAPPPGSFKTDRPRPVIRQFSPGLRFRRYAERWEEPATAPPCRAASVSVE